MGARMDVSTLSFNNRVLNRESAAQIVADDMPSRMGLRASRAETRDLCTVAAYTSDYARFLPPKGTMGRARRRSRDWWLLPRGTPRPQNSLRPLDRPSSQGFRAISRRWPCPCPAGKIGTTVQEHRPTRQLVGRSRSQPPRRSADLVPSQAVLTPRRSSGRVHRLLDVLPRPRSPALVASSSQQREVNVL